MEYFQLQMREVQYITTISMIGGIVYYTSQEYIQNLVSNYHSPIHLLDYIGTTLYSFMSGCIKGILIGVVCVFFSSMVSIGLILIET